MTLSLAFTLALGLIIILSVLGIIGLVRVSRESGSTRGGDIQEIVDAFRQLGRRLIGRRRAP